MTGKLKFRLANSALGAIITHAIVNEEGSHVVAAESGELLYWDLATREVVFKDKQEDIQQIFFFISISPICTNNYIKIKIFVCYV